MIQRKNMPDVAEQSLAIPQATLDWVGMSGIEIPVRILTTSGRDIQTLARVQAYVDLADPNAKGIHMSRLYVLIDQQLTDQHLNPSRLQQLLEGFLASHQGRSLNASLRMDLDYFERRPSLVSNNQGWRNYPVQIHGQLTPKGFSVDVKVNVLYSSTCPCSAALARQLIQEKFAEDFAGENQVSATMVNHWLGRVESILATPHSQRSVAEIKVRLQNFEEDWGIERLINAAENALQTAVQAAVKREDEQEFAKLNGQNLMFCEDAARRLKTAIHQTGVADYWIRVNHLESLHPHDAVAIVTKGVDGGFSPSLHTA